MLSSLWQTFMAWVLNAGYQGMGVAMLLEGLGIPFPGDAVMAFYGYIGSQGHFTFPKSLVWCSFGCWVGSLGSFAIGRSYGIPFLHRFGKLLFLKPKHIRFTAKLSERFGVWMLIFGRFLPGVRTLSSYFAGIGGMPWRTFLPMSFLGFAMWCTVWLGLGWWFGHNAAALLAQINRILLILTAILLAGAAVYLANLKKTK